MLFLFSLKEVGIAPTVELSVVIGTGVPLLSFPRCYGFRQTNRTSWFAIGSLLTFHYACIVMESPEVKQDDDFSPEITILLALTTPVVNRFSGICAKIIELAILHAHRWFRQSVPSR